MYIIDLVNPIKKKEPCTVYKSDLFKQFNIPEKLKHSFFKELEKIDNTDRQLVFEKLKDLENGHFENDKSLQGKHKGKFRKRAGNYRIIYLKENDILLITLVRIAHRKEVY